MITLERQLQSLRVYKMSPSKKCFNFFIFETAEPSVIKHAEMFH